MTIDMTKVDAILELGYTHEQAIEILESLNKVSTNTGLSFWEYLLGIMLLVVIIINICSASY